MHYVALPLRDPPVNINLRSADGYRQVFSRDPIFNRYEENSDFHSGQSVPLGIDLAPASSFTGGRWDSPLMRLAGIMHFDFGAGLGLAAQFFVFDFYS